MIDNPPPTSTPLIPTHEFVSVCLCLFCLYICLFVTVYLYLSWFVCACVFCLFVCFVVFVSVLVCLCLHACLCVRLDEFVLHLQTANRHTR